MKFWKTIFQQLLPISGMTHPDYDKMIADWGKFRSTFTGGDKFIYDYLEQFSMRESYTDYYKRRRITYCPAHAKSAILEIKNAIYQRMIDIIREGGTDSYMRATAGELNGVDLSNNTMNSFIGGIVLPDLLAIGKVGVYVDRDPLDLGSSKVDSTGVRPYLYKYNAEDILSWTYERNKLIAVLLQDNLDIVDPITQLVVATKVEYRLLQLTSSGVIATIYDENSQELSKQQIKLSTIPLVIFELSQSLLMDVANYQIALLNLASSDMNYALKANFPFYTEQFDALTDITHLRQAVTDVNTLGDITGDNGEAAQASKAKEAEIRVGVTQGRRYPKGLERPGFINPSSEPLKASMDKQDQLKAEIRQLVHLSLQIVTSKSVSGSQQNEHGLESGLSNIGLELEFGERQIATIWQQYEGKTGVVTLKYPNNYSLRTDEDRRKEAADLRAEMASSPSMIYQKEIAKQIATIILGHRVSKEVLKNIYKEIDNSLQVIASVDDIIKDHENGFVSTATASKIRGYQDGEAEKAKQDHAERAARIVAAQAKAAQLVNPASRGVTDLDNDDKNSPSKEKKDSADDTLDINIGKKVRGQGK